MTKPDIGTERPIERLPTTIIFKEKSNAKETYGGSFDMILLEGQHLKPQDTDCKTVLIFMHPTGVMNYLPMPIALAHRGIPVMTCASRYPHNDTTLIMEKVVLDLGQYIKHAKEKLGYENVVLAGWSGGGSLSLYYQAQAENPSVTATPAGDPPDLTQAGLIPADGMLQLAAHVSRAITLSEWIDGSILDEHDPTQRDPELDLYNPDNPNQPPYTENFLKTYRQAQVGRMQRITADVKQRLAGFAHQGDDYQEHAFVVHRTMADPRWLDPTVDANDRKPHWCYMGDPKSVNMLPAGLARYCSLRSWLSQWSLDDSHADGPACAGRISVPSLVIENSADDACTPSHAKRIFDGLAPEDKEKVTIQGATHYYFGQQDKLDEAAKTIMDWMGRKGFLD